MPFGYILGGKRSQVDGGVVEIRAMRAATWVVKLLSKTSMNQVIPK